MIPIVTPAQMNEADTATNEQVSAATLIQRAGTAVAFAARKLMAGTYGRRVLVVSGPGNNGADGAVAAETLNSWGARCDVLPPAAVSISGEGAPDWLPPSDCGECYDLVIDAAFGTGLRARWDPGPQPSAPVLAVDVPSGIDALTGYDHGSWAADLTLTFAALKPGLLLHPAATKVGRLEVADIGSELAMATTSRAQAYLLTDADADSLLAQAPIDTHKWQTAVRVVAGSQQYHGAGYLTCAAALLAGAGMVAVSTPGCGAEDVKRPQEAVALSTGQRWVSDVLEDIEHFGLLVIGPGLGTDAHVLDKAAELIAHCPLPVVVDADALSAVAANPSCVQGRSAATVLTPHEGEFDRLMGGAAEQDRSAQSRLRQDRFKSVLEAAQSYNAIVLLKGPTTLIATPAQRLSSQGEQDEPGYVYAVTSGSQRLATAGSGDVLTGVIAGAIASGIACNTANSTTGAWKTDRLAQTVAAAAHWHGRTTSAYRYTPTDQATGPVAEPTTPLIASQQIDLLPAARAAVAVLSTNQPAVPTPNQHVTVLSPNQP